MITRFYKIRSLLALLLLAVIFFHTTACIGLELPENQEQDDIQQNSSQEKGLLRYTYSYTEQDEQSLRLHLQELSEMLDTSTEYQEFLQLYEETELELIHLRTQGSIASFYRSLNVDDPAASQNYLASTAMQSEFSREFISLYMKVYDSPFRKEFFQDWTEEDISELQSLATSYTDEVSALLSEFEEIRVEYGAIVGKDGSVAHIENLYREQLDVLNKLAEKFGYDNFYDYAYVQEYDRDFTPDQAEQFRREFLSEMQRLLPELKQSLTLRKQRLSPEENTRLTDYLQGDWTEDRLLSTGSDFYKAVGGDLSESFSDLVQEENYYIANESTSQKGAYTGYLEEYSHPFIYFGPGYQNVFTFLHESGHYAAFDLSDYPESGSYQIPTDLAEVHSQGTEWLYTAYLKTCGYSQEFVLFLAEYTLYSNLAQTFMSLIVDAFERECYLAAAEGRFTDFESLLNKVCQPYGGREQLTELIGVDPMDYWPLVTVESPVYYVSYAVSLLPSLELFLVAMEDFSAASEAYTALFGGGERTFRQTLADGGLTDPFQKGAVSAIADAFYGFMAR